MFLSLSCSCLFPIHWSQCASYIRCLAVLIDKKQSLVLWLVYIFGFKYMYHVGHKVTHKYYQNKTFPENRSWSYNGYHALCRFSVMICRLSSAMMKRIPIHNAIYTQKIFRFTYFTLFHVCCILLISITFGHSIYIVYNSNQPTVVPG